MDQQWLMVMATIRSNTALKSLQRHELKPKTKRASLLPASHCILPAASRRLPSTRMRRFTSGKKKPPASHPLITACCGIPPAALDRLLRQGVFMRCDARLFCELCKNACSAPLRRFVVQAKGSLACLRGVAVLFI